MTASFSLVRKAEPLVAIADAFETVTGIAHLAFQRPNLRVYHCIDSSELCEYLVPSSICRSDEFPYPTALDFALLYLFRLGPTPLYWLPLYEAEFHSVAQGWQERILDVQARLRTLERVDLSRLPDTDEALVKYLSTSFNKVIGLLQRGDKGKFGEYQQLLDAGGVRRLGYQMPAARDLDEQRIHFWYSLLCEAKPQITRHVANMIDAHVLTGIEALNRGLPEDELVVLLSHSTKMHKCIGGARIKDPGTFMKHGVTLLQRPEVAMIRFHNIGGDRNALTTDDLVKLSQLAEQGDKYLTIREPVRELDVRMSDAKDSQLAFHDSIEPLERLAGSVERLLGEYRKIVMEWGKLALVDRELAPDQSNLFPVLRKIIRNRDVTGLRRVLAERKRDLLSSCEAIRRQISICLPTPTTGFNIKEHADTGRFEFTPKHGPRYSYDYEFVSPWLAKRISILKKAGDRDIEGAAEVAKFLTDYLGATQAEAEACLFVSAFLSLSMKWLPAHDAAARGLMLYYGSARGPLSASPIDESKDQAVITLELMLAYVSSLRRWAIQHFEHKPLVERWFNDAFEVCLTCCTLRRQWQLGPGVMGCGSTDEDPRALRELGVIILLAKELDITIARESECALMFTKTEDLGAYGRAACIFEAALKVCADPMLRLFCINNLLYALSQSRLTVGLERCSELAKELEQSELTDEPQILDSLAVYYWELAQSGVDPRENQKRARNFLHREIVSTEVLGKGYDSYLIEKHSKLMRE